MYYIQILKPVMTTVEKKKLMLCLVYALHPDECIFYGHYCRVRQQQLMHIPEGILKYAYQENFSD